MITQWRQARTLTELPEDGGIAWAMPNVNAAAAVDTNKLKLVQDLESLSNSTHNRAGLITTFTNQLVLSNFGFDVAGPIQGIEVEVISQRRNRICDKRIRLYLDGRVGKDHSQKSGWLDTYMNFVGTCENDFIYGAADDLWEVNLTDTIVNDPAFGILLQFESHPVTPHKDPLFIEQVSMRVHYG